MSFLSTITSLLFLTAGVAVVCTLAVVSVNGALRRAHAGFHELETLLAHIFGETTHPSERATRGLLGLFLTVWAATIGFFLARISGILPDGFLGVALYGAALVLVAGLVAFPLLGYGAFGRKHHPRAPVWIVALTLVFAIALSICSAVLF